MNNYLKIIVGSLCFTIITICIALHVTKNLDDSIYVLLHNTVTSDTIIQYLIVISTIFSPIGCLCMVIIILIGLFIYDRFKFYWYGFWCFSVFAIGTFLKYVIQRPRPSLTIEGYSFPSMHVLSVCVLVSLVILLTKNKVITIISVILVLSVMISRVYLKAHFFTDTMGSLCVIYILIQTLQIEFTTKSNNSIKKAH